MDKHLDNLESKMKGKIISKDTIKQLGEQLGEFAKRETSFS